jgi:tetratricopeptide (TPR) repeat protein
MKTPTALGHRIQAEMYRQIGQLDQAVAEAERAVALDSNNPEGYGTLASAQTYVGQLDLALKNLEIADRLDPENLRPNWIRHGKANLLLGNYAEAARYLELSVAAAPEFIWTYRWLIAAYGHLDKKAEAKAAIEEMNRLRVRDGYRAFTLAEAVGQTKLKRDKDKETYLQGLEKAGLKPGDDVKATEEALDTIVSRTKQGHYKVQGATSVNAKEVKALLDQGVPVFEMRHNRNWRAGHPRGALHGQKEIGDFTAANLGRIVKKDEAVVFYCGGFT